MNPYVGNKEKLPAKNKKITNFISMGKSKYGAYVASAGVKQPRVKTGIVTVKTRYAPIIQRVVPKGTQAYYFNKKGEFQNDPPLDGVFTSMKLEEVIFSCIAMNQNIAKAKFHKFFQENYKTSEQWFKLVPKEVGLKILDATGGWDEKNFAYAWEEEKIDKAEFKVRVFGADIHYDDFTAFDLW